MYKAFSKKMLEFIEMSPSCFHVVETMEKQLAECGYQKLNEQDVWKLSAGEKYYVTRNGSSLLAFDLPRNDFTGFQMICSHSDSPTFKLKPNAAVTMDTNYVKLNVEKYGGMLCAPWFDRPLSIAGRVLIKTEAGLECRLVNLDRDLVLIPSLAIHMNREANDGLKYNVQKDMMPLLGEGSEKESLTILLKEELKLPERECEILDADLYLYNRQKGSIWGAKEEYISSGKLDDLQCVYASLQGFLKHTSSNSSHVSVLGVFDNEEVGSQTRQGAASTFLEDTLRRINAAAGRNEEDYLRALAGSFMISADNAHAVHPNQMDKADMGNRPYMNQGIVLKYSANQKYTTDAVSAAIFKLLCKKADVPVQTFANRSDMIGGSTLGNIAGTKVSVRTVDVGLPQLAMHSPYETAGIKDGWYLEKVAEVFYSRDVVISNNSITV